MKWSERNKKLWPQYGTSIIHIRFQVYFNSMDFVCFFFYLVSSSLSRQEPVILIMYTVTYQNMIVNPIDGDFFSQCFYKICLLFSSSYAWLVNKITLIFFGLISFSKYDKKKHIKRRRVTVNNLNTGSKDWPIVISITFTVFEKKNIL